jgi:hypothetical protein
MGFLFFCNVDSEGNIVESISGEKIIPMKQYDYFFYVTGKDYDTFLRELASYKVINGQLTLETSPI